MLCIHMLCVPFNCEYIPLALHSLQRHLSHSGFINMNVPVLSVECQVLYQATFEIKCKECSI